MFLKRLDLQGFKTFANRTEIEFSGGMTAVVGPNGAGKSNFLDAIRWVLGEQSMRALRCKKTEDVIFAGGAGKAPAGMAEVSITFDNSTGWLDTPNQEVVVTRRAYRSGENEYYLNRARARLRDVTDLLLKANVSPNGYTVIGQGMVDLALSLKPEERRELFEDAAGIRHHHVRLHDARNRLAATEANLSRVRDVIAEVEPRLKQLERRARQLRERDGVRAELRQHLAGWYGHRWLELRAAADAAAAREAQATEALAEARAAAEASLEEVAELTARQEHLRGRLGEIDRARVELSGQAARLERELELRKERAEASRARATELRDEYDLLEERGRADEMAVAAARNHLARLESDVADLTEALAEAEGANEGRRERANLLRQQLLHAQAATDRLRQERAALESELGRTEARRRELAAEAERQAEAARRDEERILAGQAEIDRARAGQAELQRALSTNAAEAARRRDEIAGARATQEAIGVKLADAARQRATVQGRLDVLNDSRDGYAGYYAGVRSVMASRGGKLDGVVGLVAALVRVPPELEAAMEVALGSHLQDVVVDRWEHAEAAVEMLKRTNAGRATFLPLDTIRGGPPPSSPTGPGVRGRAADLVQFDEAHRPVVEHLLGRTLVVADLATARRHLLPGWQIVTLGGEIVRSGGAITGGSEGKGDRTLLARERERRELPERLARIVAEGRSLEGALGDARAQQDELEAAQRRLADDRRKIELDEAAAGREAAAAAGRVERLRREVEWSREMARRAAAELAELDARESAARARLAAFPRGARQHEQLIGALESRLAALTAATHEQSERLSTVRNSVAVIEGERRAQTRLLEGHQERRQQVEGEMEARRRRIDELIGVASALAGEIESLEAARGAVADQRASVEMETRPVQLELAALVEQTRLLQSGEPAARAQLHRLTDALRAESLTALSARDHLEALLREASLALRELEPEPPLLPPGAGGEEGVPDDAALSRPESYVADDPPDLIYEPLASPDQTWRRIELLRSRLRGIGSVDASAGQEYDEASARHAFLSGQAADLVDARKLLEEAIDELETTMQARFEVTFEAVAAAFRKQFTALFGGGTARLVLAEEDGGIEIVAQPPGKRAQSLSLLSGGERALTAVAILFAIFEVNPSPVCVLDEVDAALDDANILRFAETLRRLAERTQFVVITHNRGTMEMADSLYGITMHDRSVSRTVSLKLSDIPEKERVPA
jgi:chromosome segregation protein